MTGPIKNRIQKASAQELNNFLKLDTLQGEDVSLHLRDKYVYDQQRSLCYEFDIKVNDEQAGWFTVVIESDFSLISDIGNVGVGVEHKFFDKGIPVNALQATFPLFKAHQQSNILIVVNADSKAMSNACANLGAALDSHFEINGVVKHRYILVL